MANFPLLQLESDLGLAFSSFQIMSIMAFPEGGEGGGLFLKELMGMSIDEIQPRELASLTPTEKQSINYIELFVLRDLAGPGRTTIRERGIAQYARGRMAGQILLFALRCGRHQPRHRSTRKAIFVLSEKMKKLKAAATEQCASGYLPTSEAKIQQYWSNFQTVAHLHAADVVCETLGLRWWLAAESNGLQFFLSCADEIASMAYDQSPPAGRMSMSTIDDGRRLLDLSQIVHVSHTYTRAPLAPELKDLLLPDLDAQELAILEKYRESRRS